MRHPDMQRRKPTTAVKENGQLRGQPVLTATTHNELGDGKPATATGVIRVLIVDDHALLREGLCQLLELEDDIEVAGEVADGFTALEQLRQDTPDVILMDIRLPVMDGIALTRQISEQFPRIAVVMLTVHHEGEQVVEAMKNGARGYLLKSASVQELTDAIRRVHRGEIVVDPTLTGNIVSELRRQPEASVNSGGLDRLSEREIELVRYIAAGLSNKEIAARLSYSEKTVKNYLSIIFQKLQLRDRTQVAIFALRQGLLPDEPAPPGPKLVDR